LVACLAALSTALLRGDGHVVGDLRVLAFESRTFGGTRTLRVWLPPGYDDPRNAATHYATLYLTDGQNLFDASTNAFGPREWRVDESMTALIASGAIPPTIVVGIDSPTGEERTREYSPFDDLDTAPPIVGATGQRFPAFLAGEVIPLVERTFRAHRDAERRFLGGASFGAQIALYTVVARPGQFGGLLLESPSLWLQHGQLLVDAARTSLWPTRISVATGAAEFPSASETQHAVRGYTDLVEILRQAGLDTDRFLATLDPTGTHSATSWGARFPRAVTFLLQDTAGAALDPAQLHMRGVAASVATYQGRRALRIVEPDAERKGGLALLPGVRFTDGTIEVDVAGRRGPFAVPDDRGFIGLAFRVRPDAATYEYLYIRPDNGRALDQVRRNHSTQYAAQPAFDFGRLRKESPERYESYVDLEPGAWTRLRIDVAGTTARFYVHGATQPALVVNDLKLGTEGGGIGLWIGPGTEGYFDRLSIRHGATK
jgi:enterochelin esterase-like enzyme